MKVYSEKTSDVVVNGWLLSQPMYLNWYNLLHREKDTGEEDYDVVKRLYEQYEQKRLTDHDREDICMESAGYRHYLKSQLEEYQKQRKLDLKTNFSSMDRRELLSVLQRRNTASMLEKSFGKLNLKLDP